MQQSPARVDLVFVNRATEVARSYADDVRQRASSYDADSDSYRRLRECQCKTCFYINKARIGGAAMTSRSCGVCNVPQMYGSTATDVLCLDCARRHKLCKHCGGDLDMKRRRKLA